MNTSGNGRPKTYRVSQIDAAKQALKRHYLHAKSDGRGAAFVAAVEHIYNRLRSAPHDFGEPKYRLHAMKMVTYLAIHHPLVVEFGIHETEPVVVIRSVQYLG